MGISRNPYSVPFPDHEIIANGNECMVYMATVAKTTFKTSKFDDEMTPTLPLPIGKCGLHFMKLSPMSKVVNTKSDVVRTINIGSAGIHRFVGSIHRMR